MLATDLYGIVTGYTYLGIAFYYIIFDFISPISDEFSLIIIAWLSHNGLMNVLGGSLMAFLALYIRNVVIFYFSHRRTKWVDALTVKYPVFMSNYQREMSVNLVKTILILTFIPKVRILVPVLAGFGQVSKKRYFIVQAGAMALFIGIYYPLGVFFYSRIHAFMQTMDKADKATSIVSLLIFTILFSFLVGRYIVRKMK